MQLPPGFTGLARDGRCVYTCVNLSCLSGIHCAWLCCSVAAERHQGKPMRKRKRDEEDAAEGDVASSDEEAEIGEGYN